MLKMKLTICFLGLGLVLITESASGSDMPSLGRLRRGFKFGAADRFSHGFGKRSFVLDDVLRDGHYEQLDIKRGFRNGASDRFSHGFGKRSDLDEDSKTYMDEAKRGFRKGASDRFSHGFGKRQSLASPQEIVEIPDIMEQNEHMMSVMDMVALLQRSSSLATAFVNRYIDLNRDGFVDKEELLQPTPQE